MEFRKSKLAHEFRGVNVSVVQEDMDEAMDCRLLLETLSVSEGSVELWKSISNSCRGLVWITE